MDEPRRHLQDVGRRRFGAGGNIGIGGAPQTGKSTPLQTMVMSAAATHQPRNVQSLLYRPRWRRADLSRNFRHVGGVATRSEPDKVNRV